MKLRHHSFFCVIAGSISLSSQNVRQLPKTSGNPIFPDCYADPEGTVCDSEQPERSESGCRLGF